MFIKIGDEVVSLKQVRSVSQDEDSKSISLSLLADYEYELDTSLHQFFNLLTSAGLKAVYISKTDIVVLDNVVSIEDNDEELVVIYKDGHDESFYDTKPLKDLITPVANYEVTEDDDENVDVPRNEFIPSDLMEERVESRSAISFQVIIALILIGVVVYQVLNMKN